MFLFVLNRIRDDAEKFLLELQVNWAVCWGEWKQNQIRLRNFGMDRQILSLL